MNSITITEKDYNDSNLLYVQTVMSELFNHADCYVKSQTLDGRRVLKVDCAEYYLDIIKTEIADKVAEIVAIKYKYEYFKRNVRIGGLSETEKEILMASLIAADLDEDKKYAFDRIKQYGEIAIDGIFNFRLKPLKKKWQDIVAYIPTCFVNSQLKEFRLSPVIDVGDFETKLRNVTKYLEKGDKIKLSIRFKGRQMAHTELGKDVLEKFASRLDEIAIIEQQAKLDGRSMTMLLAPKREK